MNNFYEADRWLQDAVSCLLSAERNLSLNDYRVVVQNAQPAVELSAKAVVAHFAEPLWHHDPSPQLRHLLHKHGESLDETMGTEMGEMLGTLADDAEAAAPWHAWSTYGKDDPEVGRLSATELCTTAVAESLLRQGRRAYETARAFLAGAGSLRETNTG